MKKVFIPALSLAFAALAVAPAAAGNVTLKDAQKVSQTICAFAQPDGSLAPCHALVDINGLRVDPATKGLQQQTLDAIKAARTGDHVVVDVTALAPGAATEATLALVKSAIAAARSGDHVVVDGTALAPGAATEATLALVKAAIAAVRTGDHVVVDGTPLPPGAATEATLALVKSAIAAARTGDHVVVDGTALAPGAATEATLALVKSAIAAARSGDHVVVDGTALAPGAATEATIAAIKGLLASPLTSYNFVPQLTATPGLVTTVGTTAVPLFNANSLRHFIQVQVQSSTSDCYIRGNGTAEVATGSSLGIPRSPSSASPIGGLFETVTHVGVGAVSIICTQANTPIYSREG